MPRWRSWQDTRWVVKIWLISHYSHVCLSVCAYGALAGYCFVDGSRLAGQCLCTGSSIWNLTAPDGLNCQANERVLAAPGHSRLPPFSPFFTGPSRSRYGVDWSPRTHAFVPFWYCMSECSLSHPLSVWSKPTRLHFGRRLAPFGWLSFLAKMDGGPLIPENFRIIIRVVPDFGSGDLGIRPFFRKSGGSLAQAKFLAGFDGFGGYQCSCSTFS